MAADGGDHFNFVGGTAFAQRIGFDVLIEQLVRVQFWTVARQLNPTQTLGMGGYEVLDRAGAMHRMTVNNQVELAFGLAEQSLQELDKHWIVELAREHLSLIHI